MSTGLHLGGRAAFDIALAFAVCLGVWLLLDQQRDASIAELVEAEATYNAEALQRDIELRVAAISHLSVFWEEGDGLTAEAFAVETQKYMSDFPGLRALSYGDPDFTALYVEPSENSRAIGRNIAAFSPERRRALETARDTGQATVSGKIDLVDGSGPGFIVFVPIFSSDGGFLGTINVVFHAATWINSILVPQTSTSLSDHFVSTVFFDGQEIFSTENADGSVLQYEQRASSYIYGSEIRVAVAPRSIIMGQLSNWMPELVTSFVALLIFGLSIAMRLLKRARAAEKNTHSALDALAENYNALEKEIDVRRKAELEAELAREATSRFLATMSHEIRTPLNAIMGMFQLIERADVPDRQKKQAKSGLMASERLFSELTKVLDVTRLDAGAMQIYRRHVLLRKLTIEWADLLNALIARSGKPIEARVEVGSGLPDKFITDPDRLSQIVTNLLDNAVKFTEEGAVFLKISHCSGVKPELQIEVRDTGPGIPEDKRETIFDRFYQVDSGAKRQHQGTGLGLTICHDLARLLGGNLFVDTGPEGGARFRLVVPSQMDVWVSGSHSDKITHTQIMGAT